MIKKYIFIALLFVTSTLFAQQIDSTLINDILSIKENVKINSQALEKTDSKLNQLSKKIENESEDLLVEIKSLKSTIDSLSKKMNTISRDVSSVNSNNRQLKSIISELQERVNQNEEYFESLKQKANLNTSNITILSNDLGSKIEIAKTNTTKKLNALDNTISENKLYWVIATLGMLLLGGLMYLFLGKRIKLSKTDVETQIRNTKQSLEEESVKLDNKLIDILETQLKVKQEESKAQPISSSTKEDHSLALKVADEVVRMQKNIAKMDSSTKGIKPLSKGIERIQNNFAANGYEMINHMNKEYDERMNIDVINFITDENLSKGNRIITAIIKPQVNFNGVLIQRAQVDVSQN